MKTPLVAVLLVVPALLIAAATAYALIDDEPYIYIYRTGNDEKSKQGWLGVSIQDMTPRLARSMNLKTREGALVTDVSGDSPAHKAGIKRDDVIVEVDGKAIWDAGDLTNTMRKSKPDAAVTIVVMRGDEKKTFKATLAESPRRPVAAAPAHPMVPRINIAHAGGAFGLTIRTLNEQLAGYFGAPKGQGVLVESVKKESPAEKAGIKAGDVLLKIGERPIESTRDVRRALRKYEGEKASVEVLRKGSRLTVTFDVPEMYGGVYFEEGPGRAEAFEFDELEMPDIDIDLEGLDDLRFEMENLRPGLQMLRERLRKGGEEIRRHMDGLREQIRKEIRSVVVTTSC
jgi:S1-C subfamily serine protease